jgi:hypothetical protein
MENFEKYTPSGEIIITDNSSGKVILKTHNIIVQSGRILIGQAVFATSASQILIPTNFHMFFEKDNNIMTTPETSLSDINSNVYTETFYTGATTTSGLSANEDIDVHLATWASGSGYTYLDQTKEPVQDSTTLMYTFTRTVQAKSDYLKIVAIGMYYGTLDSTGQPSTDSTLFSRAIIDPRYLRNANTYTIKYNFYF